MARVALRPVPSMLRRDSRAKQRRHSIVTSSRWEPGAGEGSSGPAAAIPRILVHGASIDMDSGMEPEWGLAREDTMESLLSSDGGTRDSSI